MCSYRILRRMRFITSHRNIQRQPIKQVLQAAIGSLKQLKNEELGEFRLSLSPFYGKSQNHDEIG